MGDTNRFRDAVRLLWQRKLVIDSEDAWLEQRTKGLGASDAAAAIGVSPWKTPYQLWAEKVGLVEAPDLSDREWIEWGHRLEPIIAKAYAERSGRTVELWPQYGLVLHKHHEWLCCTPDAVQCGDPPAEIADRDSMGILQVKSTGAFLAKDWDNDPPVYYQVQLQHELEVTGCDWGTLAVLIGGQKLLWFDAVRNQKFILAMMAAEDEFWIRVMSKEPPEVDESPETRKILQQLHPQDNGESIALPPPAILWDEQLETTKRELKELESQKRLLENRLRAAIGDNTFGCLPDGTTYSYKTQTTNYPPREASTATFRVLRRKGPK